MQVAQLSAVEKIEPTLPGAGPTLPAAAAVVPALALVALAACCVAFARRWRATEAGRVPRAALAWVAPQFVMLALACAACPLAMVGSSWAALVALCLASLASGALTLAARLPRGAAAGDGAGARRDDDADAPGAGEVPDAADAAGGHDDARATRTRVGLGARLGGAFDRRALVTDALVLLGMTVLAFLAVDLPWNEWVLPSNLASAALQAVVLLGAMLVLLLVCQGHGGGMAAASLACAVVGLVQYFTAQFRGQALLPGDIMAAATAAAVSTGYRYVFTSQCVLALACAMVGFCVASLARPALRAWRGPARVGARLAASAVVVAVAAGAYGSVNLRLDCDIVMDYWNNSRLLLSYCEQGFIPTFLSGMQSMPIEEPNGYDAEEAAAIESEAAASAEAQAAADPDRAAAVEQFEQVRPNVVVVMNESFADISSFDDLWAGYEGPTYFSSGLSGCALRGTLTVSVNGGGTCNSEFEFLTGNTCAFIGYGKHPYATYDLEGVPSMAQDFSDMGYGTTAIHPNLASNWNREVVYGQFGFDRFVDIEEFQGAPTFHSGVTDAATYDKVVEVLRESDEPQFVFDVTMQNHSGYDQGNIPADRLCDYDSEALDDGGDAQMNEYLSCIEASDEDLEYLISLLSELDEPTVLVFFGDHQPYLTDWFNHNIYGGDTDEILHQQRMYQTSYVVWANYDLAGSEQADEVSDMSLNYLGATVKYLVGAPLTERDKANLAYHEQVPALNPFGYQTADGSWHALEGGPEGELLDDMSKVQYLRFASLVQ